MNYCDRIFLLQCREEKEVFLRHLKEKTYKYSRWNFYYRDVFLSRTEDDEFLLSSTGLARRGRSHVFTGRITDSDEGIQIEGGFGTPPYFDWSMRMLAVLFWASILAGCIGRDWYVCCFFIVVGMIVSYCLIALPDKIPRVGDRRRLIAFMEDELECRWVQAETAVSRDILRQRTGRWPRGKEIVIRTKKNRDEVLKALLSAPKLTAFPRPGQGQMQEVVSSVKKNRIMLSVYRAGVRPGTAKVFYGGIKENRSGTVIRGSFGVRKGCRIFMDSVFLIMTFTFAFYGMYLQALMAAAIITFIRVVMEKISIEEEIIRYLMALLTDRDNTPILEIRTW